MSYRQVLRVPDIRALLLATCLSRLAGRMFMLAIVLYALTLAGSPLLAGWLAFAAAAPGLVVSPLAGALIDRVGSVWAIMVDMVASAVLVAALASTDAVGLTSPPILLALTALFSLTNPLSAAGIRALLPRLVPVDALDRVNALDTASHGLSDVVGPAMAGLLVGFGGPGLALWLIALVYAGAAVSVGSIRRPRGEWPHVRPLLIQAAAALVHVAREPTLRGLAVTYSLYEVCWGIFVVAVPVSALSRFDARTSEIIAGFLWAALGFAGGISALVIGHLRTAGRERRVIALGLLATALAAWPLAAELGLAGLVAGMMAVGAMAGLIDVGVLTLRQRRTPPAQLGRVLSVSMSLNMAGGPLGSALAGVLVTWSIPGTFAAAALAAALAASAVTLIPTRPDH